MTGQSEIARSGGAGALLVRPTPQRIETPARAAPSRPLVVVANRLPTQRVGRGDKAHWELSPGGLVSALQPVISDRGGIWVGWSGDAGEAPDPFSLSRIDNRPVALSKREVERFYEGFANRTIWPLYHDAIREPVYSREWWDAHVTVNQRFADAAADAAPKHADVWIHDYHLQLAPAMLRERRPDLRIGFFLHIPFPPVEIFSRLPWREEIVAGLLGSDVVGFQTTGDAGNFLRAAQDSGLARRGDEVLAHEGRTIVARAFPISIDIERQADLSSSPAAIQGADRVRESLGRERRILLGVDRLDYSKGIEQRLAAYRTLLRTGRISAEECVFVQVAVPSREHVREYREARARIEGIVGEINGEFGDVGRVAVHYLRRSLKPDRLAAFYRAADIMVVTPLRDGMNLVAKEYVASRLDDDGVLVLSRFAGAARELWASVICNPHDILGLADSMEQAINMPADQRRERMRDMRAALKRNDVHRWASDFLRVLRA